MGIISNDIGIDIGTSTVRVYVKGKGLVIEEPCCALMAHSGRKNRMRLESLGSQALTEVHKQIAGTKLVYPVKNSIIQDNEVMLQMLHALITFAVGSSRIIKPRFFITYPAETNENNKLILRKICNEVGARSVYLISKPFAAAVGAGIKAFDAKANMIIDAGAGTIDMAAISLGDVVIAHSETYAGDAIDEEIVKKYGTQNINESSKMTYNIRVENARAVKLQLGSALPRIHNTSIPVEASPSPFLVYSDDVYQAMTPFLSTFEKSIQYIFSKIPLAMVPDIAENGIYICGGTSRLSGLESYLKNKTGLTVNTIHDPERAAINGLGSIITHFEEIMKHGKNSFLEVE